MEIIENQTFDMERALYGRSGLFVKNCSFDGPEDGESALKESSRIEADHCFFNLRYPFWHDHGLTITNSEITQGCRAALWYCNNVKVTVSSSVIKGEYLVWYFNGLTLINCKIIGTQPLCYCKNLKLIDCEMIETDLAFEKSQVEAAITTKVDSIKNSLAGTITVPDVGELVMDEEWAKGQQRQSDYSFLSLSPDSKL